MQSQPDKILIRTPNWLGDLMMATAFIQLVLKEFPHAQVDLIVRQGFEGLPLPKRGDILTFSSQATSAGRFGWSLRSKKYDRIYILPPSFSSALMAFCAGIPERFGLKEQGRRWLLSPAVTLPWQPRTRHLVEEYACLLGKKMKRSELKPCLSITPEWIQQQLQSLSYSLPKSFLMIAAGALYGPAKEWMHFAKLVKHLLQQTSHDIILVGTTKDYDQGEVIRAGDSRVHNLCGQTNLPQLVALCFQSQLLISNDSGVMHLMATLGRPQIALFGSTSPVWTAPLSQAAHVLTLQMPCSPCFARACRFGHTNCLRDMTPEFVMQHILKILSNSTKSVPAT